MNATEISDADLAPVQGRSVWRGAYMKDSSDWIHSLSDAEVADLDRAVAGICARGRRVPDFGRADFPLPVLAPVLARIREDVVDGRGVNVIRGLPVDRWSREESAIAYWGIGCHIGEAVTQNPFGHVLGHVKDIGGKANAPTDRGYRSRDALLYHNDVGGEVIGLMCLRPSKSGGPSSVVSAGAIFNALRERRPDLLAELMKPMYHDRRGEVPPGRDPYYPLPVFSRHEGRLIVCFVRRFIESAQRFPELPRLTQAQLDALDMVSALAASPEFSLDIDFAPGDIQLVNNLTTMHSRTAFEDYPEPDRKRHLLRLWLAVPGGWPLPKLYYDRYGATTPGGRPAGIAVTDPREPAPLDAA